MKKEETHYRLLPMGGAYNMRDLGGYRNVYGKHVKWKMLLRSDDLGKMTSEDLNYLGLLPLRTVIDFRDEAEKKTAPDHLPQSVSRYIQLPIAAGDTKNIEGLNLSDFSLAMREVYAYIIRNAQEAYKEFFRIVSENENAPLLFHCSAGKDRTGIAAVLLLSALGVEREIIVEDYLLSAEYARKKYEFILKDHPEFEPLTIVKRSYLDTALQVIDEDYGGMEKYLTENLEADLEKLRKLYTE